MTVLSDAVIKGDVEKVRQLLDGGESPNGVNASGDAVLLLALWNKKVDVARLLIERGADVNVRGVGTPVTDGGATTISSAICCGLPTVKLLVEKGADVHARAFGSMTGLIAAIDNKGEEIARYLIGKGARIEDRELRTGATPLIKAVERKMPDLVRFLLAKGADMTAVNKEGKTALDVALEKSEECAAVLQECVAARAAAAEAAAESAQHAAAAENQAILRRRAPKFRL